MTMESRISEILARKILEEVKGYIILPNWKAEDYRDRPEELIDELMDNVGTDLKNNNARDEEEKIKMMEDFTDSLENTLDVFEKDHDHDMLPFRQQIREKKESFAFEVAGS